MSMLLIILLILAVILLDIGKLLQLRQRDRILKVYLTLMGASLVIGIFLVLEKNPASLADIISKFLREIQFGRG